jgi:hypothetical protein
MVRTKGVVTNLQFGRAFGKVTVHSPLRVFGGNWGEPVDHLFQLFDDGDATTIAPTEMVRRNWLIGLLQRALTDQLQVEILHRNSTDNRVWSVVLHAPNTSA